MEGLGYGCKDNGLIFAINAHIWACEIPILTFGSEEQKRTYLPQLCRGEWIGGHAASEPEAGSDIYSMQTLARQAGDKYLLNGHKMFVTNGPLADVTVVFANVDPSKGKRGITGFLVDKDSPGLVDLRRQVSKMGLRTAIMGELILENCEVPVTNRLGKEGAGLAIFQRGLEWERGLSWPVPLEPWSACSNNVCIMPTAPQFGQPIGKFQLVADKMVEMKVRLETARALLHKVGRLENSKARWP